MVLKVLVFALIGITFAIQSGYTLEVVPAGFLPTARGFGNAIYDGDDSVFIVAGQQPPSEELSDILRYSLSSGEVTLVGSLPKPSKFGALAPTGNGSFVQIGGTGDVCNFGCREIFQFDKNNTEAIKIGDLPSARDSHSATYDENGSIYIFGGFTTDDTNDILKYTVATREITGAGQIPGDWEERTASAYVDGLIYVFTGIIYKFDPKTEQLENTGEYSGGAYTVAVAAGQDIYIIGGWDNRHFHKFNTINNTLEKVVVTNFPYEQHILTPGVVYVEKLNRIYIFGGGGGPFSFYDQIYYVQL